MPRCDWNWLGLQGRRCIGLREEPHCSILFYLFNGGCCVSCSSQELFSSHQTMLQVKPSALEGPHGGSVWGVSPSVNFFHCPTKQASLFLGFIIEYYSRKFLKICVYQNVLSCSEVRMVSLSGLLRYSMFQEEIGSLSFSSSCSSSSAACVLYPARTSKSCPGFTVSTTNYYYISNFRKVPCGKIFSSFLS